MDRIGEAVRGVARDLAKAISSATTVGLGSGSTVAALLEELAPAIKAKGEFRGVTTSSQIESVAAKCGLSLVPFGGSVDFVIDGADQVDRGLNLIKGGGGALLKEKVVMSSARSIAIVASEAKFAEKLGEGGVKVPVEVHPMARDSVKSKLKEMGGSPVERLLQKGFPYFTENGNIILDTGFEPLGDPREREMAVKAIPGVMEVGIFTFRPLAVYKLRADGGFEVLRSDA